MALKQTQSKKITIGETDFYIKPFPAFKAANITGELASVLTPLFAGIIPLAGDGDLLDVDIEKAAPGISKCFEGISGDKIEGLLKKLLIEHKNVVVEIETEQGEIEQSIMTEDIANEIFCGDTQDMFLLAFEIIRLNFNGFFKSLTGLSGKAKGTVGLKKKTPNMEN